MAEVKKFLFDNFVIEEKKTRDKDTEEQEALTEEIFAEGGEEKAVEEKKIIDVVPEEPDDYVPPVTYSEEELKEKVRDAEQTGYERGLKEARQALEDNVANALEHIDTELKTIMDDKSRINQELESQFVEMSKMIINQLIPSLTSEHAVEIVNKFIADNFGNLKKEAKLSFYVNPDVIAAVQDNISKLAHANDFEGKITIHKDRNLGIADARIEWDTGGVESNTNSLIHKVDDLLDDKS